MKIPRHRRSWSSRTGARGLVVAVSAALAASLTLVAGPARAAGNGVLDLEITAVNQGDGTPITEISGQVSAGPAPISSPVTYKVQYSCTTDVCDGTKVSFTPPPSDPWGLSPAGRSVLRYASWVAPAGGGSISGDDLTGKVINLGNLAPGTSGTFSVTYNSPGIAGNDSAGGQFFPDGSDIAMSATATSDTASSKTSAAHVTWRVGTPTGPNAATTANQTIRPDQTQVALISMSTGSETIFAGASIAGDPRVVATGDYKVVYHAPAQAVIGQVRNTATGLVDPDAVVDPVANTITWTKGSLGNPSYGARGGWGGPGLAAYNSGGAGSNNSLVADADKAFWAKRSVELTYPLANFPEADGSGCNFRTPVTSTLDVSVHYLDAARTAGSKSVTAVNNVACGAPFGGLTATKDVVGGQTSSFGDGQIGQVYALNVPAAGTTDAGTRSWRVNALNLGNVDGTVVVDEPNLAQDHIKVNRITAASLTSTLANWTAPDDFTATVEWEDNTGATGTSELAVGEFVDAAAGRWFTSARTTAVVPAGRVLRTDSTSTSLITTYRFKVDDGAVPLIGQQRTNTADVSISYPADADGDGTDDDYVTAANGTPLPSRSVDASAARTVQYTQGLTIVNALSAGNPVVDGGGSVLPGTNVTFGVRGNSGAAWPGTSVTPQTVFIAPLGWKIVPGSALFTAAGAGVFSSIPAGVTYRYGTGTFGTDTRDFVVATYPSPVTLPTSGSAANWPTLSAKAYPTNAAVPGVAPVANVWAGEDSGTWTDATNATYSTGAGQFRYTSGNASADSVDVDGDGNLTEEFVNAALSYPGLAVGASDGLSVVKQLCVPLEGAPDGCSWVSGSAASNLVRARSANVKYRIQVSNAGNTALHDVVAYDVLPYVGDTGLLAGAPARGSQLALPLASVDSTSSGLTVTASGSTNPARPEVNPGATGTTNDWGAPAAGKKALRIAVDGELGVGEVKEVVLSTALPTSATAGQQACNSVAVDSSETLPAEPASTCVTLDVPLNVPPTATITSPANGAELEYGSSVPATFSCDDADGNLATCGGTDENGAAVATGSALPTTTPGTHTLTVTATDDLGETATATVTYTVKRKPNVPPTVDIAKPTEGATYFVGQNVPAAYTCADSDGTVVSCAGPVPNGSNLDTATPGTKTFPVTATDNEGATASRTVTYQVVTVSGVCRGTGLSLLGLGLGDANPRTTPCATDTDKELNVNVVITNAIPLLGVPAQSVSASVITGATQSGPGSAAAQAGVASLKVSLLGQTIEATGLTSSASSVLSSCGSPAAATGTSSLASLKINGKSIANLTQPSLTVPLLIGSLGINERGVSGSTATASALHLTVLGLVDLSVARSLAGASC